MPEQVIRYTLRYSSRARWVSGRIRPETGLVITLPTHAKPQEAEAFLTWSWLRTFGPCLSV